MNTNTNSNANLPSVSDGLVLLSLNISIFDKSVKDKEIEEDIMIQKGAHSTAAASVYKPLFVNSPIFKAFKTLRGQARVWINKPTAPFDDNGWRVTNVERYLSLNNEYPIYEGKFNALKAQLEKEYLNEISKQAFERGKLFDRNEYPSLDAIMGKFSIGLSVRPFPQKGHVLVDINNEVQKDLAAVVERQINASVRSAMADVWDKLRAHVERVTERVTAVMEHDPNAVEEIKEFNEDGSLKSVEIKKKRRPKLHDSMLDDGLELCEVLKDLNFTNDPALEEARAALQKALVRIDIDTLKEDKSMQEATRKAMQDIADKFF